MVSHSVAQKINTTSLPQAIPSGYTAVFLGATSGIGRQAALQLAVASKDKSPQIFIVGRNAAAAESQLAELRQSNTSATVAFIEADISLVKSVDVVADQVQKQTNKIDLLFLSPGFIPFSGRHDTSEGLEPSMTTRYYSRVRATQLLLPLLRRSPDAHVVNILAGGKEAPLILDDLDLANPRNFSFIQASKHAATMLTVVNERFARENPTISFVHAFPGPVATPTLTRGSSGLLGLLLKYVVSPLANTLVAVSSEKAGALALLYATNKRYTVPRDGSSASLVSAVPEGLEPLKRSKGGVFLVGSDGEASGDEKLLEELRASSDKVWEHTVAVFDKVTR